MKHMRKHNPDPLTAAAVLVAQHAQSAASQNQGQNPGSSAGGGAQSRGDRSDSRQGGGGGGGRGGAGGGQNQGQSQGGHGNQGSYSQVEGVPCPFDLHQYKTVAAGDIQYKPVSVASLTAHKDLCLTVATSTIQVEHLNS